MKKILVLCILFFTVSSFAQTTELRVEWGPKTDNKLDYPFALLGNKNAELYMITVPDHYEWQKPHAALSKFSSSFQPLFKKEIYAGNCPEISKTPLTMKKALMHNDNILLLTFYSDYYSKTNHVYGSTISGEGVVNKDCAQISKINPTEIAINDDSTMIAVLEYDMKKTLSIDMSDLNLKRVWGGEIELPFDKYKSCDFDECLISKDGKIMMTFRIWLHGDEWRETLFSYDWRTNQLKEYNLTSDDNYASSISFIYDEKNKDIRVAGFYKTKSGEDIAGSVYLTIDDNNDGEIHTTLNPFDASILKNLIVKNGGELTVDQLYNSPNGNLILIAEQSNMLYKGNKWIFSIRSDGSLNWGKPIHMKQEIGTYFMGCAFMPDGDNLFLLYNDNHKNHSITDVTDISKDLALSVVGARL